MGPLEKKPHKSDPRDRGQRVCVDPARLLSLAKPRPTQSVVRGYITSGNLQLVINGKQVEIHANEAIRFQADVSHEYNNPFSEKCTAYNVIFYPDR